jgi:hypothetical protein
MKYGKEISQQSTQTSSGLLSFSVNLSMQKLRSRTMMSTRVTKTVIRDNFKFVYPLCINGNFRPFGDCDVTWMNHTFLPL